MSADFPRPSSASWTRTAIAAFAAWLFCSLAYFYTANGVAIRDGDRENAWHHYEYLVDGFLSGHLYLSKPPDSALLALPDPHDPAQNYPYRLWDASLYQGKYYLYYGPTPAVLLMLPWKVVTGHHLPQRLAAAVFAAAGLGALTLLVTGLQRRHFPHVGSTGVFLTVLLAGHITWLPVVLRRPAFWELPIVAAAALLWWGLYGLWRYIDSGRRVRWGVLCGAALAFALGARPTLLFAAAVITLLPLFPLHGPGSLRSAIRRVLPIGIPLLIGGVTLLAYNYLRFGSVVEFGQSYQLWGPPGQASFVDERHIQHFSASYLPFNAWTYLLSPPELSLYFPFVHAPWISELPRGYIATEGVFGILPMIPALLAGIIALGRAWRSRSEPSETALRQLLVASVSASIFAAGILFCFAGACSRYIVELSAGWGVVAVTGMLVVGNLSATKVTSRILRLLAGGAAAWSIPSVWLVSYEFRAFARITQPQVYPIIAGLCNYPSYWVARHAGQEFGPIVMDVQLAASPSTGTAVLAGAGSEGMLDQLILDRITPSEYQLRLTVNNRVVLQTPVLHARGDRLIIRCAAPWLYPPAAHPFWRMIPSEEERSVRQTLYQLSVNGSEWSARSQWGFDATAFDPYVRTAAAHSIACAWVDHWQRSAPIRITSSRPPQSAPRRPQMSFSPTATAVSLNTRR
jgi:hypothetical protein